MTSNMSSSREIQAKYVVTNKSDSQLATQCMAGLFGWERHSESTQWMLTYLSAMILRHKSLKLPGNYSIHIDNSGDVSKIKDNPERSVKDEEFVGHVLDAIAKLDKFK